MRVLRFEFALALRRLFRRRAQNGLLLVTFTVSVALSLLSWTLFHTVFLSQPEFDPKGEYHVMSYADTTAVMFQRHSSYDDMEAYKAGQQVFEDMAEVGFYNSVFVFTPAGEERFQAAYLSSRAMQILGAKPLLGRLFSPEDDVRGSTPTALLSQRLWENNYGSDPDIVGRTMLVTGEQVSIVGVMPAAFRFPNDQALWISYGATPNHPFVPLRDALVKLKPGVTKERAERDLAVILEQRGPESLAKKNGLKPALIPLRDFYLLPEIRVSATILFSLSLLFILLSCANATNLMLVDFLGRRPEVAATLALGIPRRAAIRGVCLQAGLVAAAAAVISVGLLPVVGPLLYERVQFLNAPYWLVYGFRWHYAGLAFGLAGVAALMTVILPVCYLLLVNPDKIIRDHAYASRGTGRNWWRRIVLTGQVAILTILAVVAGLLVHSSRNVGRSHWGYPAERIFMGKISNTSIEFPAEQRNQLRNQMNRKVMEQVQARPETAFAALADNPPGYSNGPYCHYALDPGQFSAGQGQGEAFYSRVTEDYFDLMTVPFVAGNRFPKLIQDDSPNYAIINESLAKTLWPGEDPLQRAFYVRYSWMSVEEPPRQLRVHGVVGDFQANGPTAKTNNAIFTPFNPRSGNVAMAFLFARDHQGVPTFKSLNDAVHRADPRVALFFPSTIKGQIDLMLSSVRMTTDLTAIFAMAALLLGAIGIYSITVTQVIQSSRDFGVRMALGAEPGRLWRDFTRGHFITVLIGVLLGLIGAGFAVRTISALLHGVSPYHVGTYGSVALGILLVAVLACVPSLFRLKRINPADCLRSL